MTDIFIKIGSTVCHQLPERSIQINRIYLPVCARCTGIYLSFMIGFLFLLLKKRQKGNQPFTLVQTLFAAGSFLPFMIDGAGSYLHFWQTNNLTRIITGCFAGYSVPMFFLLITNFQVTEKNEIPIIKSVKEQFFLLLISIITGVLVYADIFSFYFILSVFICAGIVLLYTHIFVLLFKLFFSKMKSRMIYKLSFLLAVSVMCIISNLIR